jgi:CRISPR-associated protein Csb2
VAAREGPEVVVTAHAAAPATTGTTIAFTFPLGRYHATAMGTSANDGVVEWPPSPWRLLRTLFSVWKTRCTDLDDLLVEGILRALASAPDYHLHPRTSVGHSRHYMPGDASGHETRLLVHDTFVVCPADRPALFAQWHAAELDDQERSALARLCASITWLGRAESLVEARLLDTTDEVPAPNSFLVPDSQVDAGSSPIRLLVPSTPLELDALVVRLSDMRAESKTRSTLPPGTRLRTYVRPEQDAIRPPSPSRPRSRRTTAVRLSVVPAETGRSPTRLPLADTIVHTAAIRQAAMSCYGKANGGDGSPALSGRIRDERDDGHGHAHYIAVPGSVTGGPADRVDAFVVWAPAGFDESDLAALRHLRRVNGFPWLSGSRAFRVIADGVGSPADLVPELSRAALTWESVTPVVVGRHPKGRRSWADQAVQEVLASCAERGLPQPSIEVREWPGRFTTVRPRPGKESHRAHPHRYSAMLRFDELVGADRLMCLGAQSHFGLGLFRPVVDWAA